MIVARSPLRILNGIGLTTFLVIMYLVSPILTSLENGDLVVIGDRVLPGVGLYDALSASALAFILLLPFFVGRQFLRNATSSIEIFSFLATAGLIYSMPLLFEIRFSPQLHFWLYGYYPTDFLQSVRGDGFRPMVFLGHGLAVSAFALMAALSAATLWRIRQPFHKVPASAVTVYLSLILIACKSLGAILYGAILIPLVRFAKPQINVRLAVAIVTIALLYPTLRFVNLFPTHFMVEASQAVSLDRAQSLGFRFDNEDHLLERALERPFFGWGRFGRSRIYDAYSGKDDSITDGRWIITMGQFGIFGFVAEFGLLAMGVYRAASALRFAESINDKILLSALSLMVAINIVDLLPNSGLLPWTWLFAGALLGRAEALQASANRKTSRSRRDGFGVPLPGLSGPR